MQANPSLDPVTGRRKNTSFKITNILPSRPASNDPEESDDPDDSRTEDISGSDLENVLGQILAKTAPVSRGKLSIVQSEAATFTTTTTTTATAMPSTATNGSFTATAGMHSCLPNPIRHRDSIDYPLHGPKDRFKVVKIESSLPLLRGRWSVVDYPDKEKPAKEHPAPHPTGVLNSMPSISATTAPNDFDQAKKNDALEAAKLASRSVPNNIQNIGAQGNPPLLVSSTTEPALLATPVVTIHHTYHGSQAAPGALQQQPFQQSSAQPQPPHLLPTMTPQPQIVAATSTSPPFIAGETVQQTSNQHPAQLPATKTMNSAGSQTGTSVVGNSNGTPPLVAPVAILGPGPKDFVDEELVEKLEEISIQQVGGPSVVEDTEEGGSGAGQGALDNRIEQAMDLVKSHLMTAVRSEVEEQKEKIVKLEETIVQNKVDQARNQAENTKKLNKALAINEFLRKHVSQDVLDELERLYKDKE